MLGGALWRSLPGELARPRPHVGPPLPGDLEAFFLAPFFDALMIAGKQHLGDFHAAKLFGPGVLRIFEQAVAKRFIRRGIFVAEYAWYQPRDGVDNDGGRRFAAAERVVAEGNFFVDKRLDPLVDAFVTAAK